MAHEHDPAGPASRGRAHWGPGWADFAAAREAALAALRTGAQLHALEAVWTLPAFRVDRDPPDRRSPPRRDGRA